LLKKKVAQKVAISLGYFISKKLQGASQSSPIGEKSSNLVTVIVLYNGFKEKLIVSKTDSIN
jgi:hypothetical protein